VPELEDDLAELQMRSPSASLRSGTRLGDRREADLGAGRLGQLEVAGQEVGVEVRLDTSSIVRPASAASRTYSSMSRRGSTTTARPVVSSPIR
jgi:hypothetical protein